MAVEAHLDEVFSRAGVILRVGCVLLLGLEYPWRLAPLFRGS